MEYFCNICPRNCNKLRNENIGKGFCKLPSKIYIAHYGLHKFEEPCISGKNGSGTIFFSGCNLMCSYCQNETISRGVCGKALTEEEFIDIIKELENMGAENINLVTPTPYTENIISALKKYKPKVPVVYNTSGYEKAEIIERLLPYVDIFLTDFKYSDNEISKLSKVTNYREYAEESLKVMLKKNNIYQDDMMKQGVIVRHLVLPGFLENTFKTFEILNKLNVKTLSVMMQFVPVGKNCPINRTLTKFEYHKVLRELFKYNFDGFVQDLESATTEYIPDFKFIK